MWRYLLGVIRSHTCGADQQPRPEDPQRQQLRPKPRQEKFTEVISCCLYFLFIQAGTWMLTGERLLPGETLPPGGGSVQKGFAQISVPHPKQSLSVERANVQSEQQTLGNWRTYKDFHTILD